MIQLSRFGSVLSGRAGNASEAVKKFERRRETASSPQPSPPKEEREKNGPAIFSQLLSEGGGVRPSSGAAVSIRARALRFSRPLDFCTLLRPRTGALRSLRCVFH